MPTAAVPVATIDKHGEVRVSEDEVGVAQERLMPSPTGDARRPQDRDQPEFCGFVALGADGGHHSRAFLRCEDIRHWSV